MAADDESDIKLVRRIRRGDPLAFDALVRRYQDRIFRLATVWLYDAEHAEDAAQEVFLRTYKGLPGFQFRSAPFTWLYSTAKNVCREYNRQRSTETLSYEPRAEGPTTEEQLHRDETAVRIRELVASLPERQRDVLLLRIFEDCSVRDTAVAMGCREGTVKALTHKAMARLRLKYSMIKD